MNDVKVNSSELAVKQTVLAPSSPTVPIAGDAPAAQTVGAESASIKLPESAPVESEQREESVEQAVTQLNDYVQTVQRNLQFTLDDDSGKTVITVTDKETSKVVRQIPDDVALRLARDLQQNEPISLFSVKV